MNDDELFTPLTSANPAAPTPRKCLHPRRDRRVHPPTGGDMCGRCGHVIDLARARRGRNSKQRGGRAELAVAREVGGTKMGPLGLPWDVEMPGYARIQVRKYATPQSLRAIASELARIAAAPGPEMPGYVWLEPGRGGEALIVFRLRDFSDRHGIPVGRDADDEIQPPDPYPTGLTA